MLSALAEADTPPKNKRGKTKCPSKACVFAILCVWQFVCLVSIIVCSVLFLKPYMRVSRYRHATCKVENSFYTNQFLCGCGWSCESLYPCLVIHVSINSSDKLHTLALYDDDIHQSHVYEEKYDKGQECSIHVCSSDEMSNRADVKAFHDQYGVRGTSFPCWYDPWSPEWGAVIRVVDQGVTVIHAMAWPAGSFLCGLLVCIIFCQRCRAHTKAKIIREAKAKETSAGGQQDQQVQLEPLTEIHAETERKSSKKKKPSKKAKTDNISDKKDVQRTASDSERKPWIS